MAAIGWYGPLIDLSQAASHRGDYVQLLVFVHTCRPIQVRPSLSLSHLSATISSPIQLFLLLQKHKSSNANEREPPISRTDIHVGDDTRSYFSVSIWNKHMGSMISAGDIVLLQSKNPTPLNFLWFSTASTFWVWGSYLVGCSK